MTGHHERRILKKFAKIAKFAWLSAAISATDIVRSPAHVVTATESRFARFSIDAAIRVSRELRTASSRDFSYYFDTIKSRIKVASAQKVHGEVPRRTTF